MTTTRASRTTTFGGLTICYDAAVLEPRDWTRMQSAWAADLLGTLPAGPVLELCCGAGQIGLLAVHGSGRALVAVDAHPQACAWTRHNATANGLDVDVREGDLATALTPAERFWLVLADPPYLPSRDVAQFPEDPVLAVDGGADGLGPARRCLRVIGAHLAPGGVALVQLRDAAQVRALEEDLDQAGLRVVDLREVPGRGVVVRLGGAGQARTETSTSAW